MNNNESVLEMTSGKFFIESIKSLTDHLTPKQIDGYVVLAEAAFKVAPEEDWVTLISFIILNRISHNSSKQEHEITNALRKQNERLTPEQIDNYIALVRAASQVAPYEHWGKHILTLIEKGLGYPLPIKKEMTKEEFDEYYEFEMTQGNFPTWEGALSWALQSHKDSLTPEQLDNYLTFIRVASQIGLLDKQRDTIIEMIGKGLGYAHYKPEEMIINGYYFIKITFVE